MIKLLKRLHNLIKNLAKQVKEQTGYDIKGDWTKYLGDAFKI